MKQTRWILVLYGVVLFAGALTGPAPAHADTSDTTAVTSAFKQAWLAVDLDALTRQMDENVAVVEPSLGLNLHSRAEFRGFLEGFLQQNPGFSITGQLDTTDPDTATFIAALAGARQGG